GVARYDATLLQAANDFGNAGYDGPEPPPGAPHRYQFSVHALPVDSLGVAADSPHIAARFAIVTQQLASATLTARYQLVNSQTRGNIPATGRACHVVAPGPRS